MSTNNRQWKGWLYLLPIIVLMGIFTFYPLVNTFLISFDTKYVEGQGFANLSNFGFKWYKEILSANDNFLNALTNTLVIVFISVPVSTIIALAISVALNSLKKVRSIFQTIFFLPYITNVIAIGLVFAVMFNSQYGLINLFLKNIFGIDTSNMNWINSASGSISAPTKLRMMIVAQMYIIWQGLPFKILIFMGGLQSVNKQLYQAAQIDSTPKWRVFRKITVPQLSPLILYIVITSLIGAFKTYAAIIGIFPESSQEAYRMQTLVGYVYAQLADADTYAKGAAGAVILFIIILIMTGINMLIAKKRVHY